MGKKIMLFLVAVLALFLGGCTAEQTPGEVIVDNYPEVETEKGRMIISMTDAAADMESVSEIRMTTSNVKAHSETEGWVTIDNEQRTYNLLELDAQNRAELMADSELNAGNYTQIRFYIEEVIIVDSEGEQEAKVPSNTYKVNIESDVNANKTTAIEFDIIADESLHITGNGKYIMAPVAEVETKTDANVTVRQDGNVEVMSGRTIAKTKVGMNAEGKVDVGLKIPANARLKIESGILGSDISSSEESNNESTTASAKGKVIVGITDAAADMGSVNEVTITVDEVMLYSQSRGWVEISDDEMTYNLLELKSDNKIELTAETEVESDNYTQVRLDVKKTVVTDEDGEHEAMLPSGTLRIMSDFEVESNSETSIVFDFVADNSLHMTGNGMYIMAPVVDLEIRENTNVEVEGNNEMRITGGSVSRAHAETDFNIDSMTEKAINMN
ncbi:MAG: DUF4382 domain-containing protein [Nanobdellota archaeon]